MKGRFGFFAFFCGVLAAASQPALAQNRAPAPSPAGRARIDTGRSINDMLNNVITPGDMRVNQNVSNRLIIWENEAEPNPMPSDPAAREQWLQDVANRPGGATLGESSQMSDDDFKRYMDIRAAKIVTPNASKDASAGNVSKLVDDPGADDPAYADYGDLRIQLPSLADLMNEIPDGEDLAGEYESGTMTMANLLPIYAGYTLQPGDMVLTSLDLQPLTPSSVMVVPSTQITGMPSAVMTAPSTQIAGPSSVMTAPSTQVAGPSSVMTAPSTQIDGMPSAVMTSPDLYPALCGR